MINEKVKNHSVRIFLLIFLFLFVGSGEAATLLEEMDKDVQPGQEIKQEQAEKIEEIKKIREITEPVKERRPFKVQTIGVQYQESGIIGRGKFEFSVAASFNRNEVSFEGYSDTITTFSIPVRLGYFLTKNIEIEPELIYSHLSQTDSTATTLFLFGNLAYNFRISSRFMFFVLGGPGINWTMADSSGIIVDQKNIAYNGGGGIKVIIGSAAIRLGYGLYIYSRNDTELDLKMDFLIHKVFLGVSIFF